MNDRSPKFLALLRGINVGGKNVIPKDALKQCFEDQGFRSVRTYIQSGNVLFRSERTSVKDLTATIEQALSDRFSYAARSVVLSERRYKAAIGAAPDGWGRNEDQKHNALFTLAGHTPKRAMAQLPSPKEDIERVTAGPGVIFWSVSKQHLTRTAYMKLAAAPIYRQLTIRNHNTVYKLLSLFDEI